MFYEQLFVLYYADTDLVSNNLGSTLYSPSQVKTVRAVTKRENVWIKRKLIIWEKKQI